MLHSIFRRPTSKFFLKTLAEITAAAESCQLGHFGDAHGRIVDKQTGCPAQPHTTDKQTRRLIKQCDQLSIQPGALHAQVAAQLLNRVSGDVDIGFNQLGRARYKFLVGFTKPLFGSFRHTCGRLVSGHFVHICLALGLITLALLHKPFHTQQQHLLSVTTAITVAGPT